MSHRTLDELRLRAGRSSGSRLPRRNRRRRAGRRRRWVRSLAGSGFAGHRGAAAGRRAAGHGFTDL